MGENKTPRFLQKLLKNRFGSESFCVLDIGTFSVKGLYMSGGEVRASCLKNHTQSDINPQVSINEEGIVSTCRDVVSCLKKELSGRVSANKVVLGVGGGFLHGKTTTQSYIRDHPKEEIREGELGNIIQKVQQRNYEHIRRDFKKETGHSELDVRLISGALLDVKIDGHQVINPLGFRGKEISCALFNSYTSKAHLEIFEHMVEPLRLDIVNIVFEPYSVFSSLYAQSSGGDFILVDIGGTSCEVSVVRKGRLDDARSISIGGASLTRSISESFKVRNSEAENIKVKFSEGKMGKSAAKKIDLAIEDEVQFLLRGLEMVLLDLSQVSLLPAKIYLYGGGAMVPTITKRMAQSKWRNALSFSSRPEISILTPQNLGFSSMGFSHKPVWTVCCSLAGLHTTEQGGETEISKLVKRSLRLLRP